MSVLIVIPARGGSKGIPRKNLRPLNGKPLLFYTIEIAKRVKKYFSAEIVVSSEDEEILGLATKLGVKVIKREPSLADDSTTLDPVIFDAFERETNIGKNYSLVVTLQPTSPLLKPETLKDAINCIRSNPEIDTLISVENDTHLTWIKKNEKYVPNYEKRINRQQLPQVFKETGGFLITRSPFVSMQTRIGKNVSIFPLQRPESIDIDTFEDFQLCEYFLRRKNIVIVTNGNSKIGLGHVYNTLSIANELVDHQITFFITKTGDLAEEKIRQYNYPVVCQKALDLPKEILALKPDVVINDILDTSASYIKAIKKSGCKIINFEDLGTGAKHADLVFNAIYPEKQKLAHHYFGYPYFILRDEFYLTQAKKISKTVRKVLITFGGVDANNFTLKVLDSIYEYCLNNHIELDVVAGLGYNKYASLHRFSAVRIHRNVKNISALIMEADVIFTSAGRTTFEVASLGIPSIVLAQNERETTHLFASKRNGFQYLGPGTEVSDTVLFSVFKRLVTNYELRKTTSQKMLSFGIKDGKKRTVKLIKDLLYDDH